MPLVDALEVLTEEGRFYNGEIVGEGFLTLWSGGLQMGKPDRLQRAVNLAVKSVPIYRDRIAAGGAPGELKHLSNRWKRNH